MLNISRIILAVLTVIAVCISLSANETKLRALRCHPQDFLFYLDFYERAFTPGAAAAAAVNPEGENATGYRGPDGARGIYDGVHLEPVKFLIALPAKLLPLPAAVFIIHALIIFAPFLYLACRPKLSGDELLYAGCAFVLYAVFPSTFPALTDNLRPILYCGPLFALTLILLEEKTKPAAVIAAFNLFMGTREESLFFAIPLVLLAAARQKTADDASRPGMVRVSLGLRYSYLLWLAIYAGYFALTGYYTAAGVLRAASGLAVLWLAGAFSHRLLDIYSRSSGAPQREVMRLGLSFLLAGLPLLAWFATIQKRLAAFLPNLVERIFTNPHFNLVPAVAVITLFIICSKYIRPGTRTRLYAAVVTVILTACAVYYQLSAPRSFMQQAKRYEILSRGAALVWEWREKLAGTGRLIITTSRARQAFHGLNNVYSFERLPLSIVADRRRFFPKNREFLAALIKSGASPVYVGEANGLRELSSGIPVGFRVLESKAGYVAAEVETR